MLVWLADLFPRAFSSRVSDLMCCVFFFFPHQTKACSTLLVDCGFANKQMARETETGRPFTASLSLTLLDAILEETAPEFPWHGWTPEPERGEHRGGRVGVFTAPFCMRNRFCAKEVSTEVSVLTLRVNRESIPCLLHQWTQPHAPAWLADSSTLTDHTRGIKWWIGNDEAVKKGKTHCIFFSQARNGKHSLKAQNSNVAHSTLAHAEISV